MLIVLCPFQNIFQFTSRCGSGDCNSHVQYGCRCKLKTAWVGASQVALVVKNPPANAGDTRDLGSIPWRKKWDPTPVFFPHSSVGKESACNAGNPSLIPGFERPRGEGIGYLLQYSWASLVAQLVKNPPARGRPGYDPWVGKIPWRRERLPTPVSQPGEFHELYSL